MPSQLSTILYVSDYIEKTSGEYFISTATGHVKLDDASDDVQIFKITVFYPHNDDTPYYLPRLEANQVLSIANSKFSRGTKNQIDVSYFSFTYFISDKIKTNLLTYLPFHSSY